MATLLVTLAAGGVVGCGGAREAREPLGVGAATARLDGVAQDGEWLGRRGAPVRITEYVDLQCPSCASFSRTQMATLIRGAVRPGMAVLRRRLVATTVPLPPSRQAALIALATASQDRLWSFTEIWLENLPVTWQQGVERVAPDLLVAVGADLAELERSLADRIGLSDTLAQARADLERSGAKRLPAFVVTGPAGRRVLSAPTADVILRAVRDVQR